MIRILTDSASDFSAAEAKALGLAVVPLQVAFGTDTYEDGVTLTPDIFWDRMFKGENPKTSQPTPDAFLRHFEEARAAGDSVVCVLLSSGLSGTVQSATLAKAMCDYEDIHIVDTLHAATGEKLLVMQACRMRDEGRLSAAQIAEEILRLRKRLYLFACLDTLDYLARGGRIPAAAAALGSLVQLKVLITVDENGKVAMAGKGMGQHRSTAALLKLIEQHAVDPDYPVIPLYTHNTDNAVALIKKLNQSGIACKEDDLSPVGATISAHVGPGVYGLTYIAAE